LGADEFKVFEELAEGYVSPLRDKGKLSLGHVPTPGFSSWCGGAFFR